MISTIKSASKVLVSLIGIWIVHWDSSLKVTDISIGLIQLFKLDKISFYRQISYNTTPTWEFDNCSLLHLK